MRNAALVKSEWPGFRRPFEAEYSGLNLNQDKATKPQTVQIVRQGEATPYWFKVNPLYFNPNNYLNCLISSTLPKNKEKVKKNFPIFCPLSFLIP